jgi:hypothetical protein
MLHTAGTLLAADVQARILRYLLLPFGKPGNTNLGKLTASAGSVTIPADVTGLPVNEEHDYKRPVGNFMSVTETAAGLEAAVKIANTRAGDDALELAAAGLRRGISVEIKAPVIRNGMLVAGELEAAGLVVKPAFPEALLMAADVGELSPEALGAQSAADAAQAVADQLKDAGNEAPPADQAPSTDNVNATDKDATMTPELLAALQALVAGKTAPAALTATPVVPDRAPAPGSALESLTASLTAMGTITDPRLMAANLDTITQTDIFDKVNPPAYVGELNAARGYIPRYMPLVTPATLTGATLSGWAFTSGKAPTVGDCAPAFSGTIPNETMNDIPTNEVAATPVTYTASRLAGGHRIDRIHTDLPSPDFWSAYLRESNDDFLRKLDAKVLTQIDTVNTAKTATGNDAASAWSKLVFGASWVLDYAVPTYAVVGNDLYRELLNSTALENLSMLNSSLGLEEGTLANFSVVGAPVSNTGMNGKVIVGSKPATTLRTLPGGPVRVDGVEVQKGAMDHGVFGYYMLYTPDARGVVKVS